MESKLYDNKKVILLGGATATGKSLLAYKIAKKLNAEIINADSMQIYKNFPILTCHPGKKFKSDIKHHLYGYIETNKSYSAAKWLKDCTNKLNSILKNNRTVIVVGGTGLYLEFLYEGINKIPIVSSVIRQSVEYEIISKGLDAAYAKLRKIDFDYSEKINKKDKQRIARSLEVFYQTGNNLTFYHKQRRSKTNHKFQRVLVMPEKEIIKKNCEERFKNMIELGLEDEIRKNRDKVINCNVVNAIGFKEINDYLHKKITLKEATEISIKKTREYAKRQCTWFSKRFDGAFKVASIKNTSLILETLEKIN